MPANKPVSRSSLGIKVLLTAAMAAVLLWWAWGDWVAPSQQDDVCHLFKTHPYWFWSAQAAQKKWQVPISLQMAIIEQESHFRANAQPPHTLLLGFIPWRRASSATGYMQALNSTWKQYLRATGQDSAARDDFGNATDFIGWYAEDAHRHLGIAKNDAYHLYLVYHEGQMAYRRKSYLQQPWLQAVAYKVEYHAKRYHQQLTRCFSQLPQKPWYHVW